MARHGGRSVQPYNPAAASAASTQVMYFSCQDPIMLRSLQLIGINPAAADADTLSVVIDYATDGSTFTACGTVAAAEYNDTDNTMALVALVPNEKIDADSWTVNRVPANALIRTRVIWTGTVTDGQIATSLTYDIV